MRDLFPVVMVAGSALFVLLLISAPVIYTIVSYKNTNTYIVTVTDKEAKRDGESSRYLVFTKLEDDSVKVFKVTDALFALKFDSSDIYAEIETGKTYEVNTIGFRIPILSAYENIMSVEESE